MNDDLMGNTGFGRAALRKLGAVPPNFRIYSAAWLEDKPQDWTTMRVTGAVFRAPSRGQNAGKLSIRVPGSMQSVIVTKDEIRAAS